MSRRPDDATPLSPAAQAVLVEAGREGRAWTHGLRTVLDGCYGEVVRIEGDPEYASPRVEAITAAVNAYARDRELLAMAREGLKRIDRVLRVPVAEYVPAIGDAFTVIDELLAALGTEA